MTGTMRENTKTSIARRAPCDTQNIPLLCASEREKGDST
jgi:hypothetical protein